MITPMIARAALHLHHIDMGAAGWGRSYTYAEAKQLRDDLLMFGYSESEVDANGTLDASDYEDEDEDEDHSLFTFESGDGLFTVDHRDGDDTYTLYDLEGNHICWFDYEGDPDDHHSIEEAAVAALLEWEARL